jgi:hypothetical protein
MGVEMEMEKHWWRRIFWKKSEGWKEVKEGRKPPRRSSSITEIFFVHSDFGYCCLSRLTMPGYVICICMVYVFQFPINKCAPLE